MLRKLYYLIAWCVITIAMVFGASFFTGMREAEELTEKDSTVLSWFLFAWILITVIMLVFAFKFQGENPAERQPMHEDAFVKKQKIRGNVFLGLSFLIALGVCLLGVVCGPYIPDIVLFILFPSFILPFVFLLYSFLMRRSFVKKMDRMKVAESQALFLKQRENAERSAEALLKKLKRIITATDIFAVFMFIDGLAVAFVGGVGGAESGSVVHYVFLSTLFIVSALCRIRLAVPDAVYNEDKRYVSSDEYPILFSLAEKAAEVIGCEKKQIRLCLIPGFNAGAALINNGYTVYIGVLLYNALTKDEVYNILLHEFQHMHGDESNRSREMLYGNWLDSVRYIHFLDGIASAFYMYSDTIFMYNFSLFRYAFSVVNETASDRAMAEKGDSHTAASALIKTYYYDLYSWEKPNHDYVSDFVSEKPEKGLLEEEKNLFLSAVSLRKDAWNKLIDKEIISRSASHPTLKMRLEVLGIREVSLLPFGSCGEYAEEQKKALAYVEDLIFEDRKETYDEDRRNNYITHIERINNWEKEGCPVALEEYENIFYALCYIGRVEDAHLFLDRVMEEFTNIGASFAYFMKGVYLLHKFDDGGIDLIYKAISLNDNYLNQGLSEIGEYCCMTGNQSELDIYREKALELSQKYVDKSSKTGFVDKKDTLIAESLPEDMYNSIKEYILSVEDDTLSDVYLFRKVITDDFFTSVFVLRFKPDTDNDKRYKVLNKVYNHLDKAYSWQFSLFDFDDIQRIDYMKLENSVFFTRDEF